MNDLSTHEPERPDLYARLDWFRATGWNIDNRRDGIALFSGLKRPTPTSLIYVVSHSLAELVARLEQIEGEQS